MQLRLLTLLSCGVVCCYPEAIDSLCKLAALTNDEWKLVEGGGVVSKVLEPNHEREMAVAGVARIRASRACFLEHFRNIESFKKGPSVRQIGKFSEPIDLRNLARLTFDSQDADALRDCEVGSCSVKVPIQVIHRLRSKSEVLGQAYPTVANSVFREEVFRYIQRYLSQGGEALIEYRDKNNPVLLSAQFHSLLTGWSQLNGVAPELCDFLIRGPRQRLPNVEEFLYWSQESFGLKPVISVTHVIIYQLPDRMWIASKQIYASHYFDTSLAITLVVDDPTDLSGRSIYLAYLNRSRIDLLGGIFGGLKRSMVGGHLEEGMKKNLQQTVTKLESSCELQSNAFSGDSPNSR